jgi:hypothetical protein
VRRLLATATLSVFATVALVGVTGARQAMAAPRAGQGCILGIICFPSPSASAAPAPSPSLPVPIPSIGLPLPGSSASPAVTVPVGAGTKSGTASPGASPTASSTGAPKNAVDPSGLVASDATAVLTAGTANITGFHFVGNVDVATAAGSQRMMEFTADSIDLSGTVTVTVTQDGVTVTTVSASQDFSDGVTLYATELSGDLEGLPVASLDLTPSTITVANLLKLPNAGLLQLANLVTGAIPLTLTGVTTDQLLISGGTQVTTALSMS